MVGSATTVTVEDVFVCVKGIRVGDEFGVNTTLYALSVNGGFIGITALPPISVGIVPTIQVLFIVPPPTKLNPESG